MRGDSDEVDIMAVITENIRRKFVKDYNLPINVFDLKSFMYFIDLYDDLYGTIHKYQTLVQAVMNLTDEAGFYNEFSNIRNTIIDEISSKEAYKKLQLVDDVGIFDWENNPIIIQRQEIYNVQFKDKILASIDLKKANFNSLKLYDPDLVNNANTYDEFISKYTSIKYFTESKQLRQVIFGKLLPVKQQSIQKQIIQEICLGLKAIFNHEYSPRYGTTGTDEILIFDLPLISDNLDIDTDWYSEIWDAIPSKYHNIVTLDFFKLEQVHPEKPFFIKKYSEDNIEFKNIPSIYLPQVFKHYYNLPIEDNDLMFNFEGKKAKFIETIY